ncbi:hypothetical protein [Natrialba hulunbeirensis]|nr:hypothetical protein [Natrialba hulunbeirensis]
MLDVTTTPNSEALPGIADGQPTSSTRRAPDATRVQLVLVPCVIVRTA